MNNSNPEVAVMGAKGKVITKGSGDAIITITSKGSCKAVVPVKVAIPFTITIIPEGVIELWVGEKFQLKADVLDEKGGLYEDQTVTCYNTATHRVKGIEKGVTL